MTTLYFVRHGETDYNQQNRYDYQNKAKLSQKGLQQAQEISDYFSDTIIDVIYSSPLTRNLDTILPLATNKNLSIKEDSRIIETVFEGLQDLTYEDIKFKNKHKWDYTDSSSGENMQDLAKRTHEFLLEIIHNHKNKTIIICSHVSPIMMMIKHIDNFDWDKDSMKYILKNTTIEEMFTKRIIENI